MNTNATTTDPRTPEPGLGLTRSRAMTALLAAAAGTSGLAMILTIAAAALAQT